jgi:hypothetical protein
MADIDMPPQKWENGLKYPVLVGVGGHNNIVMNPVFRGMVPLE